MKAAAGEPCRYADPIRTALAVALVVFAALATALPSDLAGLASGTWAERRASGAFQNVPVDAIAAELDRRLPAERRIALAPALRDNEFLLQRLSEAVYPRLVDANAPHVVDVAIQRDGALDLRGGVALARMGDAVFVLRGAPREPPPSRPPPAPAGAGRRIAGFLFAALGLLGFGFALMRAAPRAPVDPVAAPAVAMLLAAFALGVLASVATWIQVPLPRALAPGAGLAALVAMGIGTLRGGAGAGGVVALRRSLARCELALFALGGGLLCARAAFQPVTLWDGRSVWLFQARRLSAHGMIPAAELRAPDLRWSHPDYPLLLPAWLAQLSGSGGAFDERLAAIAIALLLASCLMALWRLAREQIGRLAAAAYAGAVFLAVDHATAGGYADGFLLCFLVIAFLAFVSGRHRAIGWIALAAASLTKAEGGFLAASMAAVFAAVEWKEIRGAPRRMLPFAVLLPALAHGAWTRAQGIDSVLKDATALDAARGLLPRIGDALRAAPVLWTAQGYTHLRELLWAATAATGVTALLWIGRRRAPRGVKLASGVAALWIACAFLAIGVLPEEVGWFVETALDRLLLHPAALLLLGPFLFLAPLARPRASG